MSSADRESQGIIAVRDASTGRDLLAEPQPLTFEGEGRGAVRIEIGSGGPLQISVSSDRPWLRAERGTLNVEGGGSADLNVEVQPGGDEEFAVLQFGWNDGGEEFSEHLLIWRKKRSQPSEKPKEGTTTPLPDWMPGGGG